MITLTLTAEYNQETNTWEVALPQGIEPDTIILKPTEDLPDDVVPPPFTDEELDEALTFEARPAAEIAASLEHVMGWASLGIKDGAEWSIAMRKKIQERYKW